MKLVFGKANAKLRELERVLEVKLVTFSLLSGFSCPYAKECLSQAVENSEGRRHLLLLDQSDTETQNKACICPYQRR